MQYKMFFILALLLSPFVLRAQDSVRTRENSLHEGVWAAQFGISSNFRLTSFQGSVLSIKRQYSPSAAVRLGITLGGNFSSNDNSSTVHPADTIRYSEEASNNAENISLQLQYLIYPSPTPEVNFYFGVGPTFGLDHNKGSDDYTFINGTKTTSSSSSEYTVWSVGAVGVIGVEWFASRTISLHSEYGISVLYAWNKDTRLQSTSSSPNTQETIRTNKGFTIIGKSVLFGLSAYF